jgi:hypothetical protein
MKTYCGCTNTLTSNSIIAINIIRKRNKMKSLKIVLLTAIMLTVTSAKAAIINQDLILDLQGLEWLSFDESYNVEYDEIGNALQNNAFGKGWRFAELEEAAILVESWNVMRGKTDNWPYFNVGTREINTFSYLFDLFNYDPFETTNEYTYDNGRGVEYKHNIYYSHLIFSDFTNDLNTCNRAYDSFILDDSFMCGVFNFADSNTNLSTGEIGVSSSTSVLEVSSNITGLFREDVFLNRDELIGDTYNSMFAEGLPVYNYLIVRDAVSVATPHHTFALMFIALAFLFRRSRI